MSLITLKDGPTLPQEAIVLGLRLEARGYQMKAVGGNLRLSPVQVDGKTPDPLSEIEREAVAKWKIHLLEFVSYCEKGLTPTVVEA